MVRLSASAERAFHLAMSRLSCSFTSLCVSRRGSDGGGVSGGMGGGVELEGMVIAAIAATSLKEVEAEA